MFWPTFAAFDCYNQYIALHRECSSLTCGVSFMILSWVAVDLRAASVRVDVWGLYSLLTWHSVSYLCFHNMPRVFSVDTRGAFCFSHCFYVYCTSFLLGLAIYLYTISFLSSYRECFLLTCAVSVLVSVLNVYLSMLQAFLVDIHSYFYYISTIMASLLRQYNWFFESAPSVWRWQRRQYAIILIWDYITCVLVWT